MMDREITAYRLIIYGRVQGVRYRASACEKARELGVTGWVRNESDGSVLAEVEGPAEQVEAFLAWCRQGPPRAEVKAVQVVPKAVSDYVGFEQRR